MYRRELAVLAVVATLVLWGGAATAVHAPADGSTTDAADGSLAATDALQEEAANVTFSDQAANNSTVTVDAVTLPEGGYVTIHDSSLLDGEAIGSVVGVSDYLEAGTHENVTVTLYDGVEGADFSNATAPNGTETFVAMPHQETGDDETYGFVETNGSEDGPYVVDGEAVVDDANVSFDDAAAGDRGIVVDELEAPAYAATNTTVTVNATLENTADEERTEDVAFRLEGGSLDVVVHQNVTVEAGNETNVSFEVNTTGVSEDEYIHGVTTYNSSEFTTITVTDDAQVDIDDQETNGTNVTVDSVFVPEGGYVTIHDSSLLDGEATGSVVGVSDYLDAGYYEDVTVTLYADVPGADFEDGELEDNETVIAMPHLETSNNTTYDFVATDGEDDGPYLTDGEAVVDTATVTLATDDTDADGDGAGPGSDEADDDSDDAGADGDEPSDDEAGGDGDGAGQGDNETATDGNTTVADNATTGDTPGDDNTTAGDNGTTDEPATDEPATEDNSTGETPTDDNSTADGDTTTDVEMTTAATDN